jgi:hypothetical protein
VGSLPDLLRIVHILRGMKSRDVLPINLGMMDSLVLAGTTQRQSFLTGFHLGYSAGDQKKLQALDEPSAGRTRRQGTQINRKHWQRQA